jgi:hypothetical protein
MHMKESDSAKTARLATLDELLTTTIPHFLSPPPKRATLRSWLNRARIPKFKTNIVAKRGGGTVYYSIAAVERMLRSRINRNNDVTALAA